MNSNFIKSLLFYLWLLLGDPKAKSIRHTFVKRTHCALVGVESIFDAVSGDFRVDLRVMVMFLALPGCPCCATCWAACRCHLFHTCTVIPSPQMGKLRYRVVK